MMSNHTDMQDQYCGDRPRHLCFVVSFVVALNKVNVVAVTTILVVHVGVVGHHVPRRSMAVRAMRREVWGAPGVPMVSHQVWDLGWMVYFI